ncbi:MULTISPECIES: alkaline shock response membrane anchor protein AmaP [unclassified Paenibacillus]|uniref:alkaline shock response membrane anchor protein AmaP n=1 Tax=unclassified Paenibacillus TaxID=185978 RepID=UPI00104F7351|nr:MULTISPECIES: alkaline shock response membrane anchor protein AmaP [unclassified Paenibacillus]NIK67608.1 putative alkaline shock family protein YloU [Paenibacillus sp. BK720]TCN01649.1 putative alkaline shock family protein YloU [Paenibacillus sp. BK033]
MIRIIDKLFLFIYSIVIGVISVFIACIGFEWIREDDLNNMVSELYGNDSFLITAIVVGLVLLVLSLRFFIVSLKRSSSSAPSIDQRTDFGDIRISIETIENLALKAAGKQRGVKDLKARIQASDSGLNIILRAVVDGENSIPSLTEEIQKAVKDHVEEIAGIPVSNVAVYIANVIQSAPNKSRVE